MESEIEYHTAKALLDWQIELGATEAIADAPTDRYALPERLARAPASARGAEPAAAPALAAVASEPPDPVEVAHQAAGAARSLADLRAAMDAFELCELRRGARQLVFADGVPGSRVMIIGEAPGREEDREGRPFVGRAGQLLDRMLAAVGLDRGKNTYITNVLTWRPPQNREPRPDEIAMMIPFLERHVTLAQPELLVLMGNISCQAGLGQRGVTRLRGKWFCAFDRPALVMFHPAYLLREPQAKRLAWADLLDLQARLRTTG